MQCSSEYTLGRGNSAVLGQLHQAIAVVRWRDLANDHSRRELLSSSFPSSFKADIGWGISILNQCATWTKVSVVIDATRFG